ncbi:MAG: hypothetical protein CMO01_01415 [Thalassobius sp.]|nr:hypothetical protein [Thalassovita sp.]
MNKHRPDRLPKLLLKLLRWFCHPDYLEDIEGDLLERFDRNVIEKGVKAARIKYTKDVLLLFRPGLMRPFEGSNHLNYYGMFKTHLKITFRNMLRRKVFSFFNISGLGLGLACVLGIYMWVSHELSFDKFHKKADQIYQVEILMNGWEPSVVTPAPLAESLTAEYPEIVNATKYDFMGDGVLLHADEKNFMQQGAKTDQAFFEMFNFEFTEGDASNFNSKSIILTEATSKKFFGYTSALGELVTLNKNETYTVSGILKNLPENSSFQFDFIIPFEVNAKQDVNHAWGAWFCATFIQLQANTNPDELLSKTNAFKSFYDKINKTRWSSALIPLAEVHFNKHMTPFFSNGGDIKYIWIFSIAGLLIFVLTCMNYVSLTTSRFTLHHKQVGLEKVLGANLNNIVQKYLTESFVYSVLAILLAGILLYFFRANFFMGDEKAIFTLLNEYSAISVFVGLTLAMLFLTTVLPVMMFKSVKPISLLQKRISANTNGVSVRKSLVIFQFCISICMITGTFILQDQLEFIQHKNLGYVKENLLSLKLNKETEQNLAVLQNELSQYADIKNISRSTFEYIYFDTKISEWDGKNREDDLTIRPMTADSSFSKTFGIKLQTGRFFDGRSTDDQSVVINQKAADEMGIQLPIGKKVKLPWNKEPIEIIGVVDNFNYWGLTSPIEPVFILNGSSGNLYIRISNHQKANTLSFIEKTFRKINPGYPVEYTFMSERFDQQHIYHQRTGKLFSYFGIISIIISCLSLLAMILFTTEQRTKEIGIRKVNGATVSNIIHLLSKDFLLYVCIAFVLAIPIVWFTMDKWLQIFSYRIDISVSHFLIGGVLAISAAFLTIIFQTVKAALTNPIESLRNE